MIESGYVSEWATKEVDTDTCCLYFRVRSLCSRIWCTYVYFVKLK